MFKSTVTLSSLLLLGGAASAFAAGSTENLGDAASAVVAGAPVTTTFVFPEGAGTLWDNGPVVTIPGGGFGGNDLSELQTVLGMTTFGAANQGNAVDGGNRMADDFTIPVNTSWDIRSCTFYSYQTSAPTAPSPISAATLQIWDGAPDQPGATVVFGDEVTDRLVDSVWSNTYRAADSDPLNNQRALYAVTVDVSTELAAGTYWVDYAPIGSGAFSGPWTVPVTRIGDTSTGDALQRFNGTWQAFEDNSTLTPQGLAFVCEGTELASGSPLIIPTTSHVGLAILGALLAVAAVVGLRRG